MDRVRRCSPDLFAISLLVGRSQPGSRRDHRRCPVIRMDAGDDLVGAVLPRRSRLANAAHNPCRGIGFGSAERRRSRTDRAVGYTTALVLKTVARCGRLTPLAGRLTGPARAPAARRSLVPERGHRSGRATDPQFQCCVAVAGPTARTPEGAAASTPVLPTSRRPRSTASTIDHRFVRPVTYSFVKELLQRGDFGEQPAEPLPTTEGVRDLFPQRSLGANRLLYRQRHVPFCRRF